MRKDALKTSILTEKTVKDIKDCYKKSPELKKINKERTSFLQKIKEKEENLFNKILSKECKKNNIKESFIRQLMSWNHKTI